MFFVPFKYSKRAYVVASEPKWLDISAKDANKGSTIRRIQEMLQINPEATLVFGDGKNDIELMKVAKHSYAMETVVIT
ncbi:MAG TPA: HAD hydrolase family protein [Clostridium sp.]